MFFVVISSIRNVMFTIVINIIILGYLYVDTVIVII